MNQLPPIEQRLAKVIADIKLMTNDIRTLFKRVESITLAEADIRRVVDDKFKSLISKIDFNDVGDLIAAGNELSANIRSEIYAIKSLNPVENIEKLDLVMSQITADSSSTYTKTIPAPTYTRNVWTDKERVGDGSPDFSIGETVNNVTVYTGTSPDNAFEYYTFDGEAMAMNDEKTGYIKGGSGELKDIELKLSKSINNSQIIIDPTFDTTTDPKTLDTTQPIGGFINEDGVYLGGIDANTYTWKTEGGKNTILKMVDGKTAPLYISTDKGIGINYDSKTSSYTTVVDTNGLHTNSINIATNSSTNPVAGLNSSGTFVTAAKLTSETTNINSSGNITTNNVYVGNNLYESDAFKSENASVSIKTDGSISASVIQSSDSNPVFKIDDTNGIVLNKEDGKVTIGTSNIINANGTVVTGNITAKDTNNKTSMIDSNGIISASKSIIIADDVSSPVFELTTGVITISPDNVSGDTKNVQINGSTIDNSGNFYTSSIKTSDDKFKMDSTGITAAAIKIGSTNNILIDSTGVTTNNVKIAGDVSNGPGLYVSAWAGTLEEPVDLRIMYVVDATKNNKYPVFIDESDTSENPVLRVYGWPKSNP